ncbi:GGDEF domain protein [Enhygromyxa salina]|uniref:histidine kinase n=1 Tax=Enhygromyxa salina TaxID=215803 RepID=A0A0C1ZR24_9BACT|nr:GAF domain-containing sensor histidine kinase [Enhygromyxa salina]KIG13448.1 GGDEF domain protein [Enhygromyxa salina]
MEREEIKQDEQARQAAVDSYLILDTEPDSVFDDLTAAVSSLLDVPICLVSLLDRHRQWFKSNHGLDVRETPREYAFCEHAIRMESPLIVPDARVDERFRDNPLVTGEPFIRFYAGVPLRTGDGHALGTLCAIDGRPRELTAIQQDLLTRLAKQAERALELHRRICVLTELLEARTNRQRQTELLVAMVVHDMRSPLTGIRLLAETLTPQHDFDKEAVAELCSLADRMQRHLIDMLDLVLGDMGTLRIRRSPATAGELIQAAVGMLATGPERRGTTITVGVRDDRVIQVDRDLLVRVIVNMLENAVSQPQVTHVQIDGRFSEDRLRISITDDGAGFDPSLRSDLFNPFAQGVDRKIGRGLGLAFCRRAADAHGGAVGCDSRPGAGATFWVEVPIHTPEPAG